MGLQCMRESKIAGSQIRRGGSVYQKNTDFSSQEKFPPEIAEAIKKGELSYGLKEENICQILTENAFLTLQANAKYKKACVKWERIFANTNWENTLRKLDKAFAEWDKITQKIFRQLVIKSENRSENWQ